LWRTAYRPAFGVAQFDGIDSSYAFQEGTVENRFGAAVVHDPLGPQSDVNGSSAAPLEPVTAAM